MSYVPGLRCPYTEMNLFRESSPFFTFSRSNDIWPLMVKTEALNSLNLFSVKAFFLTADLSKDSAIKACLAMTEKERVPNCLHSLSKFLIVDRILRFSEIPSQSIRRFFCLKLSF